MCIKYTSGTYSTECHYACISGSLSHVKEDENQQSCDCNHDDDNENNSHNKACYETSLVSGWRNWKQRKKNCIPLQPSTSRDKKTLRVNNACCLQYSCCSCVQYNSLMLTEAYPLDWKTSYCLLDIASLLLLAVGGVTWREQSHARSGFSAAACGACSLPHLSADKVSDKTVQGLPCHDRAILVLTREVIWLRFITHTKWVREGDPFCSWIKLRCNIWHIVLCIVVCAKCPVVWEGSVWSYDSSCWENVSDAYHPQVTAREGEHGGGAGDGAREKKNKEEGEARHHCMCMYRHSYVYISYCCERFTH